MALTTAFIFIEKNCLPLLLKFLFPPPDAVYRYMKNALNICALTQSPLNKI